VMRERRITDGLGEMEMAALTKEGEVRGEISGGRKRVNFPLYEGSKPAAGGRCSGEAIHRRGNQPATGAGHGGANQRQCRGAAWAMCKPYSGGGGGGGRRPSCG
jgi:hypothetical protein